VFHPFQDLKTPFKYGMGRTALDIGGKAYPAGIVFILFLVKTGINPVGVRFPSGGAQH
jgi:hypothetical protein